MKEIRYYHDFSSKLKRENEYKGLYMETNFGPTKGEFLGLITIHKEDYLIARTTETFPGSEMSNNKLVVRHAFLGKDSEGIEKIYVNIKEDDASKKVKCVFDRLEKENGYPYTEEMLEPLCIKKEYLKFIKDKKVLTATAIEEKTFNIMKIEKTIQKLNNESEKGYQK